MKNFCPSRFFQLVKVDLAKHRKKYLNLVAGMFIAHLAINWSIYQSRRAYLVNLLYMTPTEYGEHLARSMSRSLIPFFMLVIMFAASMLCSNLATKSERTYFLTLPATMLEKLLSRAFISFILVPIAFILTYLLGDCLRMAVLPLFDMHLCSSVPTVVRLVGELISHLAHDLVGRGGEYSSPVAAWAGLGIMFFTFTSYVTGSVVFRRHAFILVSLLLVVAGIALGTLVESITLTDFLDYFFTAVIWLLGFANLGLSWLLFKRIQVIPKKWLKK